MTKSSGSLSKKKMVSKKKVGTQRPTSTSAADLGFAVVLSRPSRAGVLARRIQGVFEKGVRRELLATKKQGYAVTIQGHGGELVRGVLHSRAGKFVIDGKPQVSPHTGKNAVKRSTGHARPR